MKKSRNNLIKISLILSLVLVTVILLFKPLFRDIKYGLDLQGGFEVLYQVKSLDGKKVTKDMVTSTYKTIQKRIDVLGVTEPNITIEGNDKIRVQLAGIKSPEEARNILSKTASLSFRDTNDNLLMNSDVLKSGGAKLSADSSGMPAVGLTIKDKEEFYAVTNRIKDMTNNRIVIWLDFDPETDSFQTESSKCGSLSNSKCLSAATVSQAFASDVIIQGNFTREEAQALVDLINSGSLPTKLAEVSSKTVSALYGAPTLNMTLMAGIIGLILIILFMSWIYRFVGVIASISVIFYTFIVFLTLYLVGGVLTLPGIAAMALGIGMAVDANVITAERMKEELYSGRSLPTAFKNGNIRSFSTILDSNVTTLIVAIILFILGESSVKGFATTLIISIVVTVLVMVVLTKYLLDKFVKTKYFDNKIKLFIGVDPKNIPDVNKGEKRTKYDFKNVDFVGKRNIYFAISLIIIITGLIFTFTKGLNLGIDYRGGSNITILNGSKISNTELEKDFKKLNYKVIEIEPYKNEKAVRIDNTLTKEQIYNTNKYFSDKYKTSTEIEVISQIVKKELTVNAIYSIIYATIGIIVYMTLRYTFTYAITGVIALIHDVLFTIGVFSIFGIEVSTLFIAAILTIIGYSINDTIVTFDRTKENHKDKYSGTIKTKEDLEQLVNESLRETVLRSIYTTFTTLLPVMALILFGSKAIINFNIALLVGLISGSYSSIFIASQLWYLIEKRKIGKNIVTKKRWFEDVKDELEELEVEGINK
jgi:SecD/SecF fusion protein